MFAINKKMFLLIFQFLILQQTYSGNYIIEQTIIPQKDRTVPLSVDWIAINQESSKIIVVADELISLASLKTVSYLRIFNILTEQLEEELSLVNDDRKINQAFFHPYDRYVYIIGTHNLENNTLLLLYDTPKKTNFALKLMDQNLNCIALSPDAKLLAVGGNQGCLAFLEPFSLEPALEQPNINKHETVTSFNFNKRGSLLASAHQTTHFSKINLWDTKTGVCTFALTNEFLWGINNIRSIFFNPQNEEELVLTIKNKMLVLNFRSKKIIFHHKHSTNSVGID